MKKKIAMFLTVFMTCVVSVYAFDPLDYLVGVYEMEGGGSKTVYDVSRATFGDVAGTDIHLEHFSCHRNWKCFGLV